MVQFVKVTGVPAVLRKLNKLEIKLRKKIIRRAIRVGGKILLKSARSKVPTGATGILKKDVKMRAIKRSRNRIGVHIGAGFGALKSGIGRAFYAFHVEVGTKNAKAQPWLRPALKEKERAIIDAIEKSIVDQIKAFA